jgi:hypothetical protein
VSSSGGGGAGFTLPDWISRLRPLLGLVGASTLGVSLVDDPIGFVQAVIIDWLGGLINDFAGFVGARIFGIGLLLADVLGEVGREAIGDPLGAIGGLIIDLTVTVQGFAEGLAAGLGPFAPLAIVLVWAGVVIVLFALGRVALEVVKWVT